MERLTAINITTAALGGLGVEAVDSSVGRTTLLETGTASLVARVAGTADLLLRLVPESVAAGEKRHGGELVRLSSGFSGRVGSASHEGGSSSAEKHYD